MADLAVLHIPTGAARRNNRAFRFAQALKRLAPDLSAADLDWAFDLWWPQAELVVEDKRDDYNRAEFKRHYAACRLPGGFRWLEIAELGKRDPLPAEVKKRCRTKEERRLVRAIARAQRWVGPAEFFLSCGHAGMVMFGPTKDNKLRGQRGKKAHAFLRRLDQEGILMRTLQGEQWKDVGRHKAKASEWRYQPMWSEDGEFQPHRT